MLSQGGKLKRFSLLVLSLAFVSIIAACATPTTPAPPTVAPIATSAPAATSALTATTVPTAAPLVKLKSAFSQLNPDAAPIWIAKDAGIFEKNGLDVEVLFIDGGTKHAQALISRDVAIGVTSAAPVVSADAAGAGLVLIAGLVNHPNYDFIVRPEIKTPADLKGKKVAVSGLSGSSYTAVRIALRDVFKFDPDKDVTIITVGNDTERLAAMLAGQVDATVVTPDLSLKAKKDGLAVLDSLWGRDIPYQHTAVGTSKAFLKDNSQTATNYVKSLIQAIGYFRDPANKANVIKIMSKYLKLDDSDVLEGAYARMGQKIFSCVPYITLDGVKTVIGESKEAVQKGLTPEQISDNSIIKSLDDSGFIKANCK